MRIHRLVLLALAVVTSVAFGMNANAAPANIAAGDHIKMYDGPGTTGGGEFYVDVLGKGVSTSPYDFTTFCLEKDEYISFNTEYLVKSITNQALDGGVNTNAGDPISSQTAYLYYKFVTGTLGVGLPAGNLYAHSAADADLFQKLIWKLEEELTWAPTGKAVEWLKDANANAGTGFWGVQVLNLTSLDGRTKLQDQLVYTGIVSEPGTLLLLGTGLIGAFAFARRRRG